MIPVTDDNPKPTATRFNENSVCIVSVYFPIRLLNERTKYASTSIGLGKNIAALVRVDA
jgi:hypothetical protein